MFLVYATALAIAPGPGSGHRPEHRIKQGCQCAHGAIRSSSWPRRHDARCGLRRNGYMVIHRPLLPCLCCCFCFCLCPALRSIHRHLQCAGSSEVPAPPRIILRWCSCDREIISIMQSEYSQTGGKGATKQWSQTGVTGDGRNHVSSALGTHMGIGGKQAIISLFRDKGGR